VQIETIKEELNQPKNQSKLPISKEEKDEKTTEIQPKGDNKESNIKKLGESSDKQSTFKKL